MIFTNHTEDKSNHFKITDIIKFIKLLPILAIFLIVIVTIKHIPFGKSNTQHEQINIEISSKLEKALKISELSTYQVTFNGVADVKDDDDLLLYYVSYNAKVSIGINMEKLKVSVDDTDKKDKKIKVILPSVEIYDVNIDPGSLDYIFENNSANTDNVSATALPACKADAKADCQANEILFELAEENAANTIKALMQPFLSQNKEYTLAITNEGGSRFE